MPGDFCSTSVSSYEEEVGLIIEDVEHEVRGDYQLLLASTDEVTASKYRSVLLLYSEARSDLDTVHIKLASDQDEKHQKRSIVNGLAGITNKLTEYDNIDQISANKIYLSEPVMTAWRSVPPPPAPRAP